MIIRLLWLLVPALLVAVPARGDKPTPPAPWYVDDQQLFEQLTEKVGDLAQKKKCLPPQQMKKLVAEERRTPIVAAKPDATRLDPEDVYERTLPGVFLIGSVVEANGEYQDGRMATAWVLAADGVLVTNWHVLEGVEEGEYFGVMDHRGRAYPVTDILAINKVADVAVFRVAATGLTALPLAVEPARVGAWVAVLGHPGDRYFTFTQGHVSRYTTATLEGGTTERWMAVTADYAYGSSGSPVVDRRGAVVGMAAMTESIDYPDAPPKEEEKKPLQTQRRGRRSAQKPPAEPPVAAGSTLQMVMKLTTPSADIRKTIAAD